jgi:hypothetical protein
MPDCQQFQVPLLPMKLSQLWETLFLKAKQL